MIATDQVRLSCTSSAKVKKMKALVLHGPGKYALEQDYPKPEVKPGWVLVRVKYAGICSSDLPRFAPPSAYVESKPNIAIVSGLYELFADNGIVGNSLGGI